MKNNKHCHMKTTKVLSVIFLSAIVLLLNNCNSDNSKKEKKKPLLDELNEVSADEEMNYFRFPSPEEIFSFIQEADMEYIPGIVNDFEKQNNYVDSKKQSLNLGIYISDLAYFTMFKQQDETFNYLNTVHKLCNAIKIDAAFSNDFLQRVHNNLYTIDSLINLSSDAYKSIVNYLEDNNKENTLALISVGTYIESLYLTMNFIKDFEKDKILIDKIANQKYAFENLYAYISLYLDKEKDKNYINMINDIKSIFDEIEQVEIPGETSTNNDGMLVLGGGVKLKLSHEVYNKLKKSINKSRNLIIE